MNAKSTIFYKMEHYFWQALSVESINFKDYMHLYVGSSAYQDFNFIYIHALPSEEILQCALDKMAERQQRYMVMIHSDIVSHIVRFESFKNLYFESTTVAMIKRLDDIDGYTFDPCVEYLQTNLSEWIKPLEDAFKMDDEALSQQYRQLHQNALMNDHNLYHFILKIKTKVVASLTLTINDNNARLDDIGTIASEQRKGYGTRLIKFALHFAKKNGAQYCTLEASSEGLHLYESLGFQKLFEYQNFIYIKQ